MTGCTPLWCGRWAQLPSSWREATALPAPPSDTLVVLETGARGFRFGSAEVWITGTLPAPDTLPVEQVVQVHWIADPTAMKGIVFRTGAQMDVWLSTDRLSIRQAGEQQLALVDERGERIVDLPLVRHAYQLDTDAWDTSAMSGQQGLCVAAEAATLADAEIRLLKRDEDARRLDHADARRLQDRLAPLLSSTLRLCMQPR